jgi:hypothetical protein
MKLKWKPGRVTIDFGTWSQLQRAWTTTDGRYRVRCASHGGGVYASLWVAECLQTGEVSEGLPFKQAKEWCQGRAG